MPRKPPGRPWVKGQSGNPRGAAMHSPELKNLRRLTNKDIEEVGSLILKGNLEALQAIRLDPNATVLKVWIASVAIKSISKGEAPALGIILDRIAGKVKERVEVSGDANSPLSVNIFSDDQVRRMAEQVLKKKDE